MRASELEQQSRFTTGALRFAKSSSFAGTLELPTSGAGEGAELMVAARKPVASRMQSCIFVARRKI